MFISKKKVTHDSTTAVAVILFCYTSIFPLFLSQIDDLKQERDKWLSLSQEETFRAGQLTDQLETERRTVQSLKDLVSELRQHNRNNGLDASMLECDDPDTSIQSLHNTCKSYLYK